MELPISIFRDYDIRGVYPQELNDDAALYIGKALGTIFKRKNLTKLVVGRDNRASSLFLSESLIRGLLSTGCSVTYINITLTPVIHFLTSNQDFDAGINVTASHNPKEFNGFRIDYKYAEPFFGADVKRVHDIILKEDFESGEGAYIEKDLTADYIEFLKSKFSFNSSLKVVIDCGSGASSEVAPRVFGSLGANLIPVYCTYDSDFPHGVPDPENPVFLEELQRQVIEHKADIGLAFDTDGDRFGFVDEKGTGYSTDRALLFFAKELLEKRKGAKVIYDVKSSQIVPDVIKSFGGEPKMLRTGHPYFVKEINTAGALLGAEFSGHVYFGDEYYGYDDGIYAGCRALRILSSTKEPFSKLMSAFPKRANSPEIKIDCPDNMKFDLISDLIKKVKGNEKYSNVVELDGIRAHISPTGWFLLRASNTSPYISVRMEGVDEAELSEVRTQVEGLLGSIKK